MLKLPFKDFSEFQEMFPVNEYNGARVRRNGILLSLFKTREFLNNPDIMSIKSPGDIEDVILNKVLSVNEGVDGQPLEFKIEILGYTFYSNVKWLDGDGLCKEEFSTSHVRYVTFKDQTRTEHKVYKKKASSFICDIIREHKVGSRLPEKVIIQLGEVFAAKWRSYAILNGTRYELHVDDNFKDIYSSRRCMDSFSSCMRDKGFHTFYENCVQAKAAYLIDKHAVGERNIPARAIIYTNVLDDDGNSYRFLERQYSIDQDRTLMQTLVDMLIARGEIDAYKSVGAGCHVPQDFVWVKGGHADGTFHIECKYGPGMKHSYQDSFKYFDFNAQVSWNNPYRIHTNVLEDHLHGEISMRDSENWDEYHNRYADETTEVHYNGRWIRCDSEDLDDFCWIEREEEYYHIDEVMFCPECDDAFITHDYYSDLTNEYYDCEDCRDRAEERWREENWPHCPVCGDTFNPDDGYYSELTGEYYDCDYCRERAEDDWKAENFQECPHCGGYFDPEEGVHSVLLDRDFCCVECMRQAEAEANNSDEITSAAS